MPCYTPESDYKLAAKAYDEEQDKISSNDAKGFSVTFEFPNLEKRSAIELLAKIKPEMAHTDDRVITLCSICRGLPISQIEAIDGLKPWYLKHLFQDLEKASNEIKRMSLK